MSNNQLFPPGPDEIEVSVWGAGYGEAIALHIGGGKWILVDSCIDPDSQLPASLDYLKNLKFPVGEAVKLIVVTHWHDDHIRGISTALDECESSSLAISGAFQVDEFRKLVSLYSEPTIRNTSGLDEFSRVFQLLQKRKQRVTQFNSPKLAFADKWLYRDEIRINSETIEARVCSLSPSDASVLKAQLAFARLLPKERERKKRVTSPRPNHASVVLWVELGNEIILLGADLENTSDSEIGWSAILSGSTVTSEKASVFKIPHHGSENAHHDDVWVKLLWSEPIAIVTPFRPGRKFLPSAEDIKRITSLTSRAYTTAPAKQRRPRLPRSRGVVRRFARQATQYMQEVDYGWGQVRLRKRMNQVGESWRVELFGDAYALN